MTAPSSGSRRSRSRSSSSPDAEHEIATAQAHLRAALETLRALAHGIFPRALAGEGLGAALEELAEDASRPVRLRHAADASARAGRGDRVSRRRRRGRGRRRNGDDRDAPAAA